MNNGYYRLRWILGLMLLVLTQTSHGLPIPEGFDLESVDELGFGFRKANVSWKGGRQSYLYRGDRRICILGRCSVSPSGRYVIYQDGLTGNLFLYRGADSRSVQLTKFAPNESVPTVVEFVWHEEAGTVDWRYGTEFCRINEVMQQETVKVQDHY